MDTTGSCVSAEVATEPERKESAFENESLILRVHIPCSIFYFELMVKIDPW